MAEIRLGFREIEDPPEPYSREGTYFFEGDVDAFCAPAYTSYRGPHATRLRNLFNPPGFVTFDPSRGMKGRWIGKSIVGNFKAFRSKYQAAEYVERRAIEMFRMMPEHFANKLRLSRPASLISKRDPQWSTVRPSGESST